MIGDKPIVSLPNVPPRSPSTLSSEKSETFGRYPGNPIRDYSITLGDIQVRNTDNRGHNLVKHISLFDKRC